MFFWLNLQYSGIVLEALLNTLRPNAPYLRPITWDKRRAGIRYQSWPAFSSVFTKTQSPFSFISELRPHTATVPLYSWITVTIQGSGDCVTSMEGTTAALVSSARAQTGPWRIRSPRPVPALDSASRHSAVTRLSCWSHLRNYTVCLDVIPVTSPIFTSIKPHRSLSLPKFLLFLKTRALTFPRHSPNPSFYRAHIFSPHGPVAQFNKTLWCPADFNAAISILVFQCAKYWVKKSYHNDRDGFIMNLVKLKPISEDWCHRAHTRTVFVFVDIVVCCNYLQNIWMT